MYDSGTELQEDYRDNDSGIQYAELSQQESRKGTRKVRAGSCAQPGLSWVRPHLGLGLSTQSSAFPGPAVSLTLSRWSVVFTEKIYNWGQCSAGRSCQQHWFHVGPSGASLSSRNSLSCIPRVLVSDI